MNELEMLFLEHGVQIAPSNHHHTRQGWLNIDCPFCSPNSNRFRMGFNIKYKYFNCWTCGNHSTYSTIKTLTGIDKQRIKEIIGDFVYKEKEKEEILGKYIEPMGILPEMKQSHLSYLKNRFHKRTFEIIKKYQLKGIGNLGRDFAWRIFIPYIYRGEKVSWTTRSISDNAVPRYKTAKANQEKISSRKLLFGEDFCRHSIIVVEGPFDAMRIGPGAVAVGGLSYSKSQVLKISKYPYRYICFDNEPAANIRADRLVNDLSIFPGETSLIKIDAKDPGSASIEEIKKLRKLIE